MVSVQQIDILLSTYNGEKYLVEQLESIFSQDINDWHLLIRDDGSKDGSVSIIEKYALRYPDKITIIAEPLGRLGIVGTFECLLNKSRSPYVAFCDQDDVWLPDKLRLLREYLQRVERISELQTPALVHSDLQVVDVGLRLVSDSFWKHQKLNPFKMQSLERLLVQNCVTGCATMVNRSLVDYALPIPKDVIMHDWWFALIAVSEGKIEAISTKAVKYRQHAMNDTGAKKWDIDFVLRSVILGRKQHHERLLKTRKQAKALLESGKLSATNYKTVLRYVDLFNQGWLRRRLEIIRMGFFKYGLLRNIGLLFWL